MKKIYCKPVSERVLPEILRNVMDNFETVSESATLPVDKDNPVDPGSALSSDSPIWDDTQK